MPSTWSEACPEYRVGHCVTQHASTGTGALYMECCSASLRRAERLRCPAPPPTQLAQVFVYGMCHKDPLGVLLHFSLLQSPHQNVCTHSLLQSWCMCKAGVGPKYLLTPLSTREGRVQQILQIPAVWGELSTHLAWFHHRHSERLSGLRLSRTCSSETLPGAHGTCASPSE